ncbi:MAG TPA: hypothetical protein VGQ82_11685, partial [Chthoniobacterales bacterium]|nr:hypothetical protein [Chthoniobacterales bacterium]
MTIKRTRAPIHLQPAHYIFAGVLLIRLFVLARLTASPFLLPAHGDMHFYDEWARRIVAGQLGDHLAFYGLPGYAYLLAGIYKLCGYGPFVPGLLQALLDAATAVLLYKISVRIFAGTNARGAQIVGALAAFGWAFFVPAQTYAAVLMPTAWLIFVFWFIIWRVVREANAPTKLSAAVFGLLIGVAATGIATILFLLPLLVGAIWLKPISASDGKFRARLAALALLFLSLFAGTAPCWIHNYFVAHDRVFLSAHSGIN